MALISFEDAIKHPPIGSTFVLDTSFIINSLRPGGPEYKLRNALAGKVGFVYNVIVRKEMLHFVRHQMMANAINNNGIQVNKSVKSVWKYSEGRNQLKNLCDSGYAEIFRVVFGMDGELLDAEVTNALLGFLYANGKKNTNSSNWDQACALMALYGLDSSDAMILNFAVGDATYDGLITSDADFRICGDVKSKNRFDIILPAGAKNRVACKPWRVE